MDVPMFIMLFSLFLCLAQGAVITPQGWIPIRAYGLNQNYQSEYQITANIPTNIYSDAIIEVIFPPGFVLSSDCVSYMRIGSSYPSFNPYSCSKYSITAYRIQASQISSGVYEIYLQGVTNPSGRYGSGTFQINTYSDSTLIDQNAFFGEVPLLDQTVTSLNATASITGYTQVNQGSKLLVNFAVTNQITGDFSIKVDLPNGFTTQNPTCVFQTAGQYVQTEALPDSRKILCTNIQVALNPGTYYALTLIGVVNPNVTGIYTNFGLQFLKAETPNVLEAISFDSQIDITPGDITISVVSTNLYRRSNATHLFQLIFADPVPQNGQIYITFSNAFTRLYPNCTPAKGFTASTTSDVSCALQSTTNKYEASGFQTISGVSRTEIEISLQNPLNPGTYIISVYTADNVTGQTIDSGTYSMVIVDIYGSTDLLSFHALEFSNPLGSGETGSLEFTFFLNNLLPATEGTQSGKIIIEVYPQIPQPPSGTVVCFFFENYTAVTCNYDTSNAAKTVITIQTPNDIDYWQSEIPIVVTTQGATGGNNGIRLPDLVQRYNFYMYFYIDGAATWEEVAFADYYPAARTIPASDFSITPMVNEANEYTTLQIVFTNNYIALNAQYDFILQFDHSNNAWEPNLGWGAKTVWYQKYDYPCIVEGAGTNYYCQIRPGTALGTTSTIVVMFQGNMVLALGATVTFYFPYIQLGTNPSDNMQGIFKIRQYTPGQLANYIDIYTYTFSSSGIIAQDASTTYTTITSGTYTPLTISSTANVAMSFACTNGAQGVIYQFPASFSITTSTPTITNCDGAGGTCYVYGGSPNFNWVQYIPSSSISSGTCTTSLSTFTQLYPYSTTISVTVRTYAQNSNGVIDRKILNRVLPAGDLTVAPASLAITAVDTTTYQNGIHIFQISFVNNYAIPTGGSITVTMGNAAVPSSLQAIATAGLTATTNLGVVIQQTSSTVFTVTNFNSVAASTTVTIQARFQLNTNPSPTVKVTTLYTGGQTIDQGGPVSIATPLTLTIPFFQSIGVVSTRPQKIVHLTQDGQYQFTITPSVTGFTGGFFYLRFPTSGFTLPASTDDVVYIVGSTRRAVTFTTSPLVIKLPYNAADWAVGVATTISIYTDYSANNKKGIIAPTTTAGWYKIVYEFRDSLSVIQETNMDYFFVPPVDFTSIRSTVSNGDSRCL